MIRITLCVIFILGGAWTGMFYAGRLSSRKRALGELMRGLQLFKNEIYYTRERLEKAAARAGRAKERYIYYSLVIRIYYSSSISHEP